MSRSNAASHQMSRIHILSRDNVQTPYITNSFGKYVSQFNKFVKPQKVTAHSRAEGPLIRSRSPYQSISLNKNFSSTRQNSCDASTSHRSLPRSNSASRFLKPPSSLSFSESRRRSHLKLLSPKSYD